jgi:hypothetical protein
MIHLDGNKKDKLLLMNTLCYKKSLLLFLRENATQKVFLFPIASIMSLYTKATINLLDDIHQSIKVQVLNSFYLIL